MDTRICLAHGDSILVTGQQGLGGWFGGGFTRHRSLAGACAQLDSFKKVSKMKDSGFTPQTE